MEGGEKRDAEPAQQRQVQPIDMGVDDIEFGRVPRHRFQQRCLGNHRVRPRAAEAKRAGPDGMKPGRGLESPLANSVTSWPRLTSSSTSHATTRSVPP